MNIPWTIADAQAVVNLLDIAVKAGGLGVAESALHFAKMIKAAADAEVDADNRKPVKKAKP